MTLLKAAKPPLMVQPVPFLFVCSLFDSLTVVQLKQIVREFWFAEGVMRGHYNKFIDMLRDGAGFNADFIQSQMPVCVCVQC
jgi:hypothetical protein